METTSFQGSCAPAATGSRTWTESEGREFRAACSCGWRGEWYDARYLASRERGAHACSYGSFRSGLSFADVRAELAAEQAAAAARGERMYVTRRTVLGRWHSHKRQAWEQLESAGLAGRGRS